MFFVGVNKWWSVTGITPKCFLGGVGTFLDKNDVFCYLLFRIVRKFSFVCFVRVTLELLLQFEEIFYIYI